MLMQSNALLMLRIIRFTDFFLATFDGGIYASVDDACCQNFKEREEMRINGSRFDGGSFTLFDF